MRSRILLGELLKITPLLRRLRLPASTDSVVQQIMFKRWPSSIKIGKHEKTCTHMSCLIISKLIVTLHCITLHQITLHSTTLHHLTLHYIRVNYTNIHSVTLHCMHYIASHYATQKKTLHCLTLPRIPNKCRYIHV